MISLSMATGEEDEQASYATSPEHALTPSCQTPENATWQPSRPYGQNSLPNPASAQVSVPKDSSVMMSPTVYSSQEGYEGFQYPVQEQMIYANLPETPTDTETNCSQYSNSFAEAPKSATSVGRASGAAGTSVEDLAVAHFSFLTGVSRRAIAALQAAPNTAKIASNLSPSINPRAAKSTIPKGHGAQAQNASVPPKKSVPLSSPAEANGLGHRSSTPTAATMSNFPTRSANLVIETKDNDGSTTRTTVTLTYPTTTLPRDCRPLQRQPVTAKEGPSSRTVLAPLPVTERGQGPRKAKQDSALKLTEEQRAEKCRKENPLLCSLLDAPPTVVVTRPQMPLDMSLQGTLSSSRSVEKETKVKSASKRGKGQGQSATVAAEPSQVAKGRQKKAAVPKATAPKNERKPKATRGKAKSSGKGN